MNRTLPKKQIRKMLKLKIIEYFETQNRFSYESGIDSGYVSRFINCTKDPTKKQEKVICGLLKTRTKKLFEKSDVE